MTLTDVSEQVQARRQPDLREEQMRQRQKLEAVGTLARGVAHGINNLLTTILGSAELASLRLGGGHPAEASLQPIVPAGLRALDPVRQIVAGGRVGGLGGPPAVAPREPGLAAAGTGSTLLRSMAAEPIRYYHRRKRVVETEQVFGEGWVRFAYENPAGRFFVWLAARRALFSQWYGRKMNKRESALQVLPFIARYGLNVDEFAKSAFDYKTFNEFFYRALKPEARPIAAGDGVAVLPADGRHLVFPDVTKAGGFYVKGATFALAELLGDMALTAKFAGGAMLISRLCPVDYHRFHFPVAGVPGDPRLINGWLYSVSPIALRRNVRYLVENKRAVTLVESERFGTVAVIEVGATNVGSIMQSFIAGRPVAKGDEKGLFAFGGSCVITLFQRGRIEFDADLAEQSAGHLETYALMGESLGRATGG